MWSVPFNLNLYDTHMGIAMIYNQAAKQYSNGQPSITDADAHTFFCHAILILHLNLLKSMIQMTYLFLASINVTGWCPGSVRLLVLLV